MDYTLSHIILPMLKQLKETKQGSPNVDLDDVPKELHPPEGQPQYGPSGEVDDNFFKRWDWVMDEMIWAFTQIAESNNNILYDEENRKEDQKRRDEAFKLFGKYYESLWD